MRSCSRQIGCERECLVQSRRLTLDILPYALDLIPIPCTLYLRPPSLSNAPSVYVHTYVYTSVTIFAQVLIYHFRSITVTMSMQKRKSTGVSQPGGSAQAREAFSDSGVSQPADNKGPQLGTAVRLG